MSRASLRLGVAVLLLGVAGAGVGDFAPVVSGSPLSGNASTTSAKKRVPSFGRPTTTNMNELTAGRKRVSRFTAPANGKLTALSAYLDGNGSGNGAGQTVRLVVYADRNGSPARLLGQTRTHHVAKRSRGAWVRLALAHPVRLHRERAYHFGVHSGDHHFVGRYGNVAGLSGGMKQNDDGFADGASDRFGGAVESIDIGLSVRAHYVLALPPSRPRAARAAPRNVVQPRIVGLPRVGQLLIARLGTWRGNPTPRFAFEWQRCGSRGFNCRQIAGATLRHRLRPADRGKTLRLVVTASNAVGVVRASSPRTDVVKARLRSRGRKPPFPPPSDEVAHLWVHPQSGGLCTRSAAPVAYDPARACSSFAAAYGAANAINAGSRVLVRGGSYQSVRIVGNRRSPNRITFAPAARETVTFTGAEFQLGDGVAANGPKYVTVEGIVGARFGAATTCPDCRYGVVLKTGASHIELQGVKVGSVMIHGSTDVLVRNSALGPCRARTVSNASLTATKSGCGNNEIDHFGAQPKRITFDNVVIHDFDFSPSCFSTANGGTNTAGQPDCHWEPMFVIGVDGFTLRNSVIRDSFMGVVVAISGPDAAATGNKNVVIENNFFGTPVNYGAGRGRYHARSYGRWESVEFSHCDVARPGVYAFENIVYRFNSGSRRAGFTMDLTRSGCRDKIRNVQVIGNIGLRNGCTPGVTYRHNVYSNGGRCDPTDRNVRAGSRIPFYKSDTHAPRARDFLLAGRRGVADNRVPVASGCPKRDKFGKRRGAGGLCDAGASER